MGASLEPHVTAEHNALSRCYPLLRAISLMTKLQVEQHVLSHGEHNQTFTSRCRLLTFRRPLLPRKTGPSQQSCRQAGTLSHCSTYQATSSNKLLKVAVKRQWPVATRVNTCSSAVAAATAWYLAMYTCQRCPWRRPAQLRERRGPSLPGISPCLRMQVMQVTRLMARYWCTIIATEPATMALAICLQVWYKLNVTPCHPCERPNAAEA